MTVLFLALRALVFYLILALSVVVFSLALYILLPLPFHWGRKQIPGLWSHFIRNVGRFVCGLRYEISGTENIPATPVVFLVKHQSAWETMALPASLPPISVVCKEALLNIPIFGWSIRIARAIPINRSAGVSAFKKVIQIGQARLQEGLSVLIFPEGTRVAPREHPRFHKTGVLLALNAGVPIIPIAHNSGLLWRRNEFIKRPGLIRVVVGPAIDTHNKTPEMVNEAVHAWMQTQMEQLEQ